jgi:orotidine-5'-phosphate decarboxylase
MSNQGNWDKLIVALDVIEEAKIKEVVSSLYPRVKKFKIGLIAFSRFGPSIVNWINNVGAHVFLDFKLYDIPHTMSETAKSFLDLNVWAYTVHVRAGEVALRTVKKEVADAAEKKRKKAPLIIGVTELTSEKASLDSVMDFARLAKLSGLDGVVSSVWEAKMIKESLGLLTITPGIRVAACGDDQKRIATFKDVLTQQVDFCVVGRPIIEAKDYVQAASAIIEANS